MRCRTRQETWYFTKMKCINMVKLWNNISLVSFTLMAAMFIGSFKCQKWRKREKQWKIISILCFCLYFVHKIRNAIQYNSIHFDRFRILFHSEFKKHFFSKLLQFKCWTTDWWFPNIIFAVCFYISRVLSSQCLISLIKCLNTRPPRFNEF